MICLKRLSGRAKRPVLRLVLQEKGHFSGCIRILDALLTKGRFTIQLQNESECIWVKRIEHNIATSTADVRINEIILKYIKLTRIRKKVVHVCTPVEIISCWRFLMQLQWRLLFLGKSLRLLLLLPGLHRMN